MNARPTSLVATAATSVAFALLVAACGGGSTAIAPAATTETSTQAVQETPDVTAPPAPGATPAQPGPTPAGADVTSIDACTLLTGSEAEATLGVPLRPPFGGGATPGVNVRSCLYASKDGNGPQVGVAVSGSPDPFRPDLASFIPDGF